MGENWNELQDAMPHKLKVERKEPYALRSQVAALERRCADLERTTSVLRFSPARVAAFMVVILFGPPIETLFVMFMLAKFGLAFW